MVSILKHDKNICWCLIFRERSGYLRVLCQAVHSYGYCQCYILRGYLLLPKWTSSCLFDLKGAAEGERKDKLVPILLPQILEVSPFQVNVSNE